MTANTKSLLNHSKRQRKKALLYHSCDLQKDKDQQQNQLKECSNNNLSKEDDNAIIYKKFAVIGMATVDGNCSHFFEAAGEQEAYIKFARDAIGVSGTIAAGALALVDVSKEAIAALTLSTGAAYSVLDTYTKNFLFGSDNIHGVRTLIMNSLHVHHDAVMNDKSPWTFENSMRVILDHQEICRSSSIVHLVRAAIEKGNVVPMQLSKETDAQVAAVDRYYELLIASELGVSPGNVLRLDELAALYWYYVLTPSTDNEKQWIEKTLSGLEKGPFKKTDNDQPTMTHDNAINVANYLAQLSGGRRKALSDLIQSWKPTVEKTGAGATGLSTSAPAETGVGSKHFSVTVE